MNSENDDDYLEFDGVFRYFKFALENSISYKLTPNVVYFSKKGILNARATKSNGYFIMEIAKGLIEGLIYFFLLKKNLDKQIKIQGFIIFLENTGIKLNSFLYEVAILYSFYHEEAHLIQKSELGFSAAEINNSNEWSIEEKHNLELDADEFAGINLSRHVVQKFLSIEKKNQNKDVFEKILITCSTSILLYRLKVDPNKEIYFLEKKEISHPHTVNRVITILFGLINYSTKVVIGNQSINYKIDAIKLIKDSLSIANDLAPTIADDFQLIDKFIADIENNGRDIFTYIKLLENKRRLNSTLAVSKFNSLAKKV